MGDEDMFLKRVENTLLDLVILGGIVGIERVFHLGPQAVRALESRRIRPGP